MSRINVSHDYYWLNGVSDKLNKTFSIFPPFLSAVVFLYTLQTALSELNMSDYHFHLDEEEVHPTFGFEAEEQRIKSKYRTRLARVKAKMMVEDRWNTLPSEDQKRAEKELVSTMDRKQEKELRKAALDWGKVLKGELSIGGDDDEEAEGMDMI